MKKWYAAGIILLLLLLIDIRLGQIRQRRTLDWTDVSKPSDSWYSGGLRPGDARVQWAANLLNSGTFFNDEHHLVPPGEDPDHLKAAVHQLLKLQREQLPDHPVFTFVDGIALSGVTDQPVFVMLDDDSAFGPSILSLPNRESHQTYLIFRTTDKRGRSQLLHLLIWPKGNGWVVAHPSLHVEEVGRWNFDAAIQAARNEENAGHYFTAASMFAVAHRFASGPQYRTAARQNAVIHMTTDLNKKLGWPEKPLESSDWRGTPYAVSGLGCTIQGDGVYLGLDVPVEEPTDNNSMQLIHQHIARILLTRHPELAQYFAGVAVGSVSADPSQKCYSLHPMSELIRATAK
ncbi:MAG: hypothetical protein ACYC26_17250 [Phycisphaerales bacterium]